MEFVRRQPFAALAVNRLKGLRLLPQRLASFRQFSQNATSVLRVRHPPNESFLLQAID